MLWWGLSLNSRNIYTTAQSSYYFFCKFCLSESHFPVTLFKLTKWMAYLHFLSIRPKTIKKYLCGLRSGYVDTGDQDLEIFNSPTLKQIVVGIKQIQGEPRSRERLSISPNLLLRLVRYRSATDLIDRTLKAAYCLAFAAFLQVGEFTYSHGQQKDPEFKSHYLTRQSIKLEKDRLYVFLPSSKTDPFRKGITITVAATGDDACPVKALNDLLVNFPLPPTAPLFQGPMGAFTRTYLTRRLQEDITTLGISGNYTSHSFQQGAATTAKQNGLSENDIQLLGRWKSDAYKLYIQTSKAHIVRTSLRFQYPTTTS